MQRVASVSRESTLEHWQLIGLILRLESDVPLEGLPTYRRDYHDQARNGQTYACSITQIPTSAASAMLCRKT